MTPRREGVEDGLLGEPRYESMDAADSRDRERRPRVGEVEHRRGVQPDVVVARARAPAPPSLACVTTLPWVRIDPLRACRCCRSCSRGAREPTAEPVRGAAVVAATQPRSRTRRPRVRAWRGRAPRPLPRRLLAEHEARVGMEKDTAKVVVAKPEVERDEDRAGPGGTEVGEPAGGGVLADPPDRPPGGDTSFSKLLAESGGGRGGCVVGRFGSPRDRGRSTARSGRPRRPREKRCPAGVPGSSGPHHPTRAFRSGHGRIPLHLPRSRSR